MTPDENAKIEIRQALARGYCNQHNENKVLDPDLIEAMAMELDPIFADLRRERDEWEDVASEMASKLAASQAECERLRGALQRIADGDVGQGGYDEIYSKFAKSALSTPPRSCEHDTGDGWLRKDSISSGAGASKHEFPSCPFCKPVNDKWTRLLEAARKVLPLENNSVLDTNSGSTIWFGELRDALALFDAGGKCGPMCRPGRHEPGCPVDREGRV